MTIDEKYSILKSILLEMGHLLIAYSGGVDSTFLLKVAKDVLGDKVIAVHAVSPMHPSREYDDAKNLSSEIGAELDLIDAKDIIQNEQLIKNPVDRCYICKSNILKKIKAVAEKRKIKYIADGSNADDSGDFRPGIKALKEHNIRSPLKEAGLTKQEIRELSRRLNLSTWEKPALACLATRFPYGTRIELKSLNMIDNVENILCEKGFKNVRARHYEEMVKIEVPPDEIKKFMDSNFREKIIKKIKEIGYTYVTLDLEGYRQGSMNEILSSNASNSG
ncbi:ATP-dependent sacrificial sulfur transferase LarE [candidate division KSB1 bacterium]